MLESKKKIKSAKPNGQMVTLQKKVVKYGKKSKITEKMNNFKIKNIAIFTRGLLSIKKRFK